MRFFLEGYTKNRKLLHNVYFSFIANMLHEATLYDDKLCFLTISQEQFLKNRSMTESRQKNRQKNKLSFCVDGKKIF